jgi:RND family efflux transporter MFP subunit
VIARYSGKVDTATRTMKAEVDVPNPNGKFIPGMYASVRMPLEEKRGVLCVPLQALTQGPQPSVTVLNSDRRIEERKVAIGIQTAGEAEISSGLKEGDLVVVGNRSGLHPGQRADGKITDLAAK